MKYRKKPVVIEAFQITLLNEEPADQPAWLREAFEKGKTGADGGVFWMNGSLFINTLEGRLEVSLYDWIIKGVAGEIYPCKPDIFEATYTEAGAYDGSVSDGYHTFDELYEHRFRLFLALMQAFPAQSWASKVHSDGTSYEGWFVCGMSLPSGQISYHLPDRLWPDVERRGIHENPVPEFDGHTSDDVLKRLAATSFGNVDIPSTA